MTDRWPSKLTFRRGVRALRIDYEGGRSVEIPFKRLREESPSAENKGHGSGPPPPRAPIAEDITVTAAEPIGRYAVRIVFSDGHSTGLYTWDLLDELAQADA